MCSRFKPQTDKKRLQFQKSQTANIKNCISSLQAARILLPGADFPPRGVAFNFEFSTVPGPGLDELDFVTTVRDCCDIDDDDDDGNYDDDE